MFMMSPIVIELSFNCVIELIIQNISFLLEMFGTYIVCNSILNCGQYFHDLGFICWGSYDLLGSYVFDNYKISIQCMWNSRGSEKWNVNEIFMKWRSMWIHFE